MSTGLAVFDTTVQQTNEWLKGVEIQLPPCGRHESYAAMRAVLHVLRDRLPTDAVMGLSAQLPILLRGVFLDGWRPNDPPTNIRDPEAFAQAVKAALPPSFPRSADDTVTAVFGLLAARLDPGEVNKLVTHLPAPLHAYWPTGYRGA